jgi:hypothetical protein
LHILQIIVNLNVIISIALNVVSVIIFAMKLRNISVSEVNYQKLRNLGHTGQSFNDVITELVERALTTKDPKIG